MALDRVAKEKILAAKTKANTKAMAKVAKVKKAQAKKLRLQRKLGAAMGVGGTCVVLAAAAVMIFPVVDYVKGRLALMKKDYMQAESLFGQIGRASCRERV